MSDKGTVQELLCLVNHVFLPPELPQAAPGEREESRINTLLCQTVLSWANAYMTYLSTEEEVQWVPIIEMLEQLLHTTQSPLSQLTLQRDFSQLKENGMNSLCIMKGIVSFSHHSRHPCVTYSCAERLRCCS